MRRISYIRWLASWRQKGRNNYYILLVTSVLVGFLTGIAAVILKNSVHFVHEIIRSDIGADRHVGLYFVFPLLGMILTYFYLRLAGIDIKPGIPNLLYSISKNNGYIKPHNTYSSILGAILTVGFGAPTGLESPNITTGGAIGSEIARYFKLPYRQRILLLGIASAGTISAIFRAPLTGIAFALEVIMVDLTSLSIIPIVLASITASLTSFLFWGNNHLYPLTTPLSYELGQIPYYLFVGLFTGVFALFFSNSYKSIRRGLSKIHSHFVRMALAGVLISLLVFSFPAMFGEGYLALNDAIRGDFEYLTKNDLFINFKADELLFLTGFLMIATFKALATNLTVAAGGVGGFFTPILFAGANIGLFLSHLASYLGYKINHQNSALVSMAGLIAGMLHAPLTAVFFIAELTGGFSLLVPLLITSAVSYIFIKFFQEQNFFAEDLAKQKILLTHHADHNILTILNIQDLIETNFVTVHPGDTLGDLVEAVKNSVRDLFPVVDEKGNFLGVVSLHRIRKIMFKPELYDKIKVSDLMIFPTVFADIREHLEDIAEKIHNTRVYNLVILDRGKYVGFISRSNFFLRYRELLREFSAD